MPRIPLADGSMALLLQEAIYQLLRLAGLLEALPLPGGSAQADLVAASISQKATLAEREVSFRAESMTQPYLFMLKLLAVHMLHVGTHATP